MDSRLLRPEPSVVGAPGPARSGAVCCAVCCAVACAAACGSNASAADAGAGSVDARLSACESVEVSQEIRITDALGSSLFPSLAWSGNALGLAWYDEREGNAVWFATLGLDGEPPAETTRVTRELTIAESPTVAAGEGGFGIAWEQFTVDNYEIYAALADESGAVTETEKRVTDTAAPSQYPALASSGTGFRVAWVEALEGGDNEEIYAALLDADGDPSGAPVRITDAAGVSFAPTVAAGEGEYAIAWHDWRNGNGDLYMARMDAAGLQIGADVQLTTDPADSFVPALVRGAQGEYGVAWHDNRGSVWDVYFARVEATGVLLGLETRVSDSVADSTFASIVFTGSEYGIVWQEEVDGNRQRIMFARFSPAGERQGETIAVSSGPGMSAYPSLAWTGNGYAVAWQDDRDGNYEIYLALLDCQ